MVDERSRDSISLGAFESERDAAKAHDAGKIALFGREADTNFDPNLYTDKEVQEAGMRIRSRFQPRPSKYQGVYQIRGSSRWKAEVSFKRYAPVNRGHGRIVPHWKMISNFVDDFDTEEEAAEAHDEALREKPIAKSLKLPLLNFPREEDYFDEETWEDEKVSGDVSTPFLGVAFHQPTGQFTAKFGPRTIGVFPTEVEAARAYDKVALKRGGASNFPPPKQLAEGEESA